MNFSDLLSLPFDANNDIVNPESVLAALPNTPAEVVRQFYADHGRKDDFQSAYGKLRIDRIKWALVEHRAETLIAASMNEDFRRWFNSVADRAAKFSESGWSCIDTREKVRAQWEEHGTWLVPPVFLSAHLVGSEQLLHLAEGHTRVGLLAGLVMRGVLSVSSVHQAWLACEDAV